MQCPHCSEWLHARCLEEQATRVANTQDKAVQSKAPKKKGKSGKRNKTTGDDSISTLAFEAKLIASDTSKTRLTVTDKREGQNNRQWDVDIPCLVCDKIIEKAGDDAPEEVLPRTPAVQMGDDALEDEEELDGTAIDTPYVAKPPAEDADQDVAIKDAPTSDTAAPEPEPAPAAIVETKGESSTEPSSSD